jgi:hypothetical protein
MNRLSFSSVGESYPAPDFASPLGFRRGEWMRVDRNETPDQVSVMVIAFSLASVRASPFLEPNVEMWLNNRRGICIRCTTLEQTTALCEISTFLTVYS